MRLPSREAIKDAVVAWAKAYGLALAVSSFIGFIACRLILKDGGQPGMPLDDSYIHFVYARRFAEGHPFTFGLGDGFSSGATSFLWPLVLAPFYLVGFRGLSLVYVVWFFGTLLHAATAVETKRLAERLAGRAAAVGAGAMCLFFGAFAWFAWSGMETIGLAWAMTRTARMASDYCEAEDAQRTRRKAVGLGLMAAMTTLIRPEGGFIALAAAVAIAAYPPSSTGTAKARAIWFARTPALFPVAAIAWVPIMNTVMVGHARTTTAMVKWAVGNPYYRGERLVQFITGNARMLVEDLLSGGPYTAIFMPEYSHYVFFAGALALLCRTIRLKIVPRGVFAGLLVLATFIPCTFITILWNRVRYIWPFAPGWFVLVACLGAELRALAQWIAKRNLAFVPALVTGVYAGALSTKLSWAIADLANSSRAITEQQVKLGMWAEKNLPKDARIGLNDTGAIAYFSERRTFDVVGLTTEGEAQYWVAGAGSRYEHYERMDPDRLPTHFIVYPQWFACPSVLGDQLYEATVLNQSILGGATKVVYEADWSVLGRGAKPLTEDVSSETLVDEVDVSDLESERDHEYALFWAVDADNLVTTYWSDNGETVSDGGRGKRTADRFVMDFTGTTKPKFFARLSAPEHTVLKVSVDGVPVASLEIPPTAWGEVHVELPAATGKKEIVVEAPEGRTFGSLHYWLFAE